LSETSKLSSLSRKGSKLALSRLDCLFTHSSRTPLHFPEGVAAITEEEIVRETSNTFLGDYRTRTYLRVCQEWSRGDISADFYEPVKSDVPVLMLSSEFDPATPPQFGRAAAEFPTNSRQIVIRNIVHGYGSDCLRNITADFISKGSAEQLDTACVAGLRPPTFVRELPVELEQ
jgi:hypothetical protein